jgi:hypothetical protein
VIVSRRSLRRMTKVCCGPFPPMPASLTLFMRSPDLSRRTRCERVRGWCLKTPVLGLWLVDSVTGSREGVHRRVLHVGLPVYPAGDYDLLLSPHPWSTSVAHTYPHGPHTHSHIERTHHHDPEGALRGHAHRTLVRTVIFHGSFSRHQRLRSRTRGKRSGRLERTAHHPLTPPWPRWPWRA